MNSNVAAVFDLSPAEKLQLLGDLWDDLASCANNVPLHAWQLEELDATESEMAKNPDSWLTWEEVKKRARSRHGL